MPKLSAADAWIMQFFIGMDVMLLAVVLALVIRKLILEI